MKRFIQAALAALCLSGAAIAQTHDDVRHAPACKHCGMDREKFAASRMELEYDDGSKVGTCSLHCAAVDLAVSIDGTPKAIRAADLPSERLVDAEKAFWVLGGARPGVMTKRAKWAFEDRAAAEAFAKEVGGEVGGFEDALKASYADMYEDTKMIREKRKAARAKAAAAPAAAQPASLGR